MEYERLSDDRLGKPSAATRQRVEAARDSLGSQPRRFQGTALMSNADTPALAAQVQMWGRQRCGATAPERRGGRLSTQPRPRHPQFPQPASQALPHPLHLLALSGGDRLGHMPSARELGAE